MVDILFIAFLGERELEELLPEDEAERERLLQDANTQTTLSVWTVNSKKYKKLQSKEAFMLQLLTCGQGSVYVCFWSWWGHVWGGSFDEETSSSWDSVFYVGRKI